MLYVSTICLSAQPCIYKLNSTYKQFINVFVSSTFKTYEHMFVIHSSNLVYKYFTNCFTLVGLTSCNQRIQDQVLKSQRWTRIHNCLKESPRGRARHENILLHNQELFCNTQFEVLISNPVPIYGTTISGKKHPQVCNTIIYLSILGKS